MIGVLLLAHGNLAQAFLSVIELIQPNASEKIKAIRVDAESDLSAQRASIDSLITALDDGEGVILVTDLFGGTPANLAISFLGTAHVEVIAGMNLPMLLKIISLRKKGSLKEVALAAQEAGRHYICIPSLSLEEKPIKDKELKSVA